MQTQVASIDLHVVVTVEQLHVHVHVNRISWLCTKRHALFSYSTTHTLPYHVIQYCLIQNSALKIFQAMNRLNRVTDLR